MTLDRLLAPRSVAVVGASVRPGSFGERLAIEALRSPGVSRVDLVNPAYDTVQGQPVRARRSPTSTNPSTWSCSASRTPSWPTTSPARGPTAPVGP